MQRLVHAYLIYSGVFLCGLLMQHQNRAESAPNYVGHIELNETYAGKILEISAKSDAKFHRWRVALDEAWLDFGKRSVSGEMLLYVDSARPTVAVGDRIVFHAPLQGFPEPANPGDFDAKSYWYNQGVTHQSFVPGESIEVLARAEKGSFWTAVNKRFHAALEQQLGGDELALAKGILLGDKSEIRTEVRDAFSGAGAMHLLAVSGLHVGVFLVIIQFFFKKFLYRIPRALEWVMVVAILWLYAGITGFSPSVNRAVLMFSFVALGMVYGKQSNSLNNLFVSALILLCINPMYLFDIGFQLSYLAMCGIFLFSQPISRSVFWSNSLMAKVWEGTAVAIAAQIGTFPLTLYYFHQFPTYFLLTNIGLMVFSGVVLTVGLLTVTLSAVPGVNWLIAYVTSFVLFALLWFINHVHSLPGALIRGIHLSVWEVFLLFFLIGLFFFGMQKRSRKWIVLSVYASLLMLIVEVALHQYRKFSSEFVVLHANVPAFSFKQGNQGVLLIYSNRATEHEKFLFQKRGLENHYGIPFELVQLPQKKGRFELNGTQNWQITYTSDGIRIEGEKSVWHYVHKDPRTQGEWKDARGLVLGRWLSLAVKEEMKTAYPKAVWDLEEAGSFRLK